jgi:hypothetical protein
MTFHRQHLLAALLWLIVMVLAVRFIQFSAAAAVRPSPGFVAAYTAARLVYEGADASQFYDDDWFIAQVGRFEPGIGDIFVNPPTTSLLLLPLAGFDYATARLIWTALNLLGLVAIVGWLLRQLQFKGLWVPAAISFALLYQPFYANMRGGQVYIFLLGLLLLVWHGYRHKKDALLGITLGLMLVLKLATPLLWPLLLVQKRWRALFWGFASAGAVVLLSLPWLGVNAWIRHITIILKSGSRPESAVTAYQTVFSFFRHLLTYDAQWNPDPLLQLPALGAWLPWLAFAVLLGVSLVWAYKVGTHDQLFAAFTILSVILSPWALEHHYPLLFLPLAILTAWVRREPGYWPWVVWGLGLVLIAAPLSYQVPLLTGGRWAFLAYPRLYGALLLWGLALWGTGLSLKGYRGLLAKVAPLLFLLLFWGVSITYLDRFPVIHNDETSILAPGYNLFEEGVYGLDMYTGHQERERIYLEVMPLMSWVQGLSSWFLGVGVWQMRFVPVVAGLFTLALTFALARRLAGRQVGWLTLGLLLFWQWGPGGYEFLGSGIALIDLSRVGRYDILVAPLSVAILWCWVEARKSSRPRLYFLCGLLVGLAGLAQLYGLFWLGVLAGFWLLEHVFRLVQSVRLNQSGGASLGGIPKPPSWGQAGLVLAGVVSAMSVWLILVWTNWTTFTSQFSMHEQRFNLFSAAFYVNNLSREGERYFLGTTESATLTRLGFWVAVLVLPVALLWLTGRVVKQQNRQALWLLLPCLIFPLLLALLLSKKSFGYLLLVMPLWVTAVAWVGTRLWQRGGLGRGIVMTLSLLVVGEGLIAMGQMQTRATIAAATHPFFAQLHQIIPDAERIVGPQTYWLAFPDQEYRSFILVFALGRQGSLETALTTMAPEVIIVNDTMIGWLALHDEQQQPTMPYAEAFWAFLDQHQARLIGQLRDPTGEEVQVYQLSP